MPHHHKASPSLTSFSSALVTNSSLKAQMDLLQQGPATGHRANGSLEADLPVIKRRRGRRKNVEGLELLFMGNRRTEGVCRRANVVICVMHTDVILVQIVKVIFPSASFFQDHADGPKVSGVEGLQDASRVHKPRSVSEQSPSARSLASGNLEEEETAVSNKELGEWLRQHPTYTMDMPGFTPVSPLVFSAFLFDNYCGLKLKRDYHLMDVVLRLVDAFLKCALCCFLCVTEE